MKKSKKKEFEKIDLENYGQFRIGLTDNEIKEYLKNRANTTCLGNLYKKFCNIAGVNAMGVEHCPCCNRMYVLMYRWDVERFANQLFGGCLLT